MYMIINKKVSKISSTQSSNELSCNTINYQNKCIKTKDECFKLCDDNKKCKVAEFTSSADTAEQVKQKQYRGCTLFTEEDYKAHCNHRDPYKQTSVCDTDIYNQFSIPHKKNGDSYFPIDQEHAERILTNLPPVRFNNLKINEKHKGTNNNDHKGCFIHSCDDSNHLNIHH